MKSDTIYLDHAAATPVDVAVLAAMQPYFAQDFFNPSATYLAGRSAHRALEAARGRIAHWLGARPSEVVFTAGGTEANNTAIFGIMSQFPDANIVTSAIEHESVLAPAHRYNCREVGVSADGRIDLEALRRSIDDQTVLVSVMYANNEIGTVQPIREIAQIIAEIRRSRGTAGRPLYLHTDACQAVNYLDVHVARLGVDLMTLNSGKIYGPNQSGALYVKAGLELQPLIAGGGQERGLRSGTENVAGAVGLAAAFDLVQGSRHEEVKRLQTLQRTVFKAIEAKLPTAVINGSRTHRLPNNIHITIPGQDNERLLILLDEAGIQAAAGSACSASNEEPSYVLKAIGLSEMEAQASLRFSMGRTTTPDMMERVVDALAKMIR